MPVTLLDQPPTTPIRKLGPYRRADYAALPDEPRCELVFGRFYSSPSPIPLHQFLVTAFWEVLHVAAKRTGGIALVAPMDVHLAAHSVVQPDVLYISPAKRGIIQNWIEGPPDLVVEILSPSTASRDQVHKLNLYAKSGIPEFWIVNPQRRFVTFLVLKDGVYAAETPNGGKWTSPVTPDIALDLDDLWAAAEQRFGPPSDP